MDFNNLRVLDLGFGPLYNSPWGDHNRLHHKLPWMHFFKERFLDMGLFSKVNQRKP